MSLTWNVSDATSHTHTQTHARTHTNASPSTIYVAVCFVSWQHCSKSASASWMWLLRSSVIIANKPWPRITLTMTTTALILIMAVFNMVSFLFGFFSYLSTPEARPFKWKLLVAALWVVCLFFYSFKNKLNYLLVGWCFELNVVCNLLGKNVGHEAPQLTG